MRAHLAPLLRSCRRASAACVLLFIASSLAIVGQDKPKAWDLKAPAPAAQFTPAKIDKLDELSCTACHADVVEEWASTGHALAWVDEQYVDELKEKKKPESCWGCHIPKPVMQSSLSARPTPRDDARRFGVACESCHLGPDGVMLGPRGTPTSAHASKASDAFTGQGSDALCIACHKVNIGPVVGVAKDFEQSGQEKRGQSCVGCHSANVEMRFAKSPIEGGGDKGGEKSGDPTATRGNVPLRKGKSHALQTPRDPTFLRRAFELSLHVLDGKSLVTVKNAAGHRVPGLIGRKITFKAEALDAQGNVLTKGELVIEADTYLPVDQSLDLALSARAAEVHVVGLHDDPRASAPVTFIDERLKP